jgi:hypothetical protein
MSQPAESRDQRNSSEDATNRNNIKENPIHTPVSEKGLVYDPTGGQPEAVSRPKSATTMVVATILGGWLLAVAFACAHHGFGLAMDKRMIPNYPKTNRVLDFRLRSQDSIKSAATAFVRGVVLSLTVAAGGILTQMVCIVFLAHLHVAIYIFNANMTPRYRSGVFQPNTQFHSTNSTRSSNFPLLYRLSPSFSPPSFLTSG